MKTLATASQMSRNQLLAIAWMSVSLSCLPASAAEDVLIINVAPAPAPAAANANPQPQPAAAQKQAKPAKQVAKQRVAANNKRFVGTFLFPSLRPNPLMFSFNWLAIKPTDILLAAAKQKAAQRRLAVARPQPANAAAQNAIELQIRKMLEPMLKTELSFASRAAGLNAKERQIMIADSKEWFDKFVVDFVKNQDPNQQQMFLQGMQGVWFGGQAPKVENPRDSIRAGVAKIAASKLPKEKVTAYANECRKRDEFYRQVSVDNLVERLDEKVKLSPDQWKKITKSLNDHWDKARDPQLEAFAINSSMWPGAPDQWVLPELSPAQQTILKRMNMMSGRMFFGGGIMGGLFGGDGGVIDDIDFDVVQPVEEAK